MDAFLLWIGLYNALAPLVFVPMIFSERFGDLVLRRGTEIIREPYAAGPYTGLWLAWIATTNAAIGAMMLLARGWPAAPQRDVVTVVIAVYVAMWIAMVIGGRGPRWGRGIYVTHGLWIGQIVWAWLALQSG